MAIFKEKLLFFRNTLKVVIIHSIPSQKIDLNAEIDVIVVLSRNQTSLTVTLLGAITSSLLLDAS